MAIVRATDRGTANFGWPEGDLRTRPYDIPTVEGEPHGSTIFAAPDFASTVPSQGRHRKSDLFF